MRSLPMLFRVLSRLAVVVIGLVILADLISEDEPKKKAEGSDDESEGAEAETGDEPEGAEAETGDEPEAKAEDDEGEKEE